MVYKSDQERAIGPMVNEAIRRNEIPGEEFKPELHHAAPEFSDVGSSPSNGKAERAMQLIEDLTRTYLSDLQARLNVKMPTDQPLFRKLLEHTAGNLKRCVVTSEGKTPYEHVHGKKITLTQAELGENSFYYIPKRV